jgi:hypothetical protein
MNYIEFSQNGNYIPIDQPKAMEYIFGLLEDYDTKRKNGLDVSKMQNPYVDKIVMPVENGKFVGIPEQLQAYAVEKWLKSGDLLTASNNLNKKNALDFESNEVKHVYKTNENEKTNTEVLESNIKSNLDTDDEIIHSIECVCKMCTKKNKTSESYYFCISLVILFIIFILGYLYTSNQNNGWQR